MSVMGKGSPSTQLSETLYNRLVVDDIIEFNDFHIGVIDIFVTINSALPGKNYDVPSREEVKKWFKIWEETKDKDGKKSVLINFMKETVNLSKVDDLMLIAGIVTPPAAMVAKRAGESFLRLKALKAIPDVLFVPSATLVALISVKFFRRFFLKKIAT